MIQAELLLPGLYRFADSCNVYLVVRDGESLAIDFGTGAWLEAAQQAGLPQPTRLYLTHHHPDQCAGLAAGIPAGLEVHAPAGEEAFLAPDGVRAFWKKRRAGGVPASYAVLEQGIPGILYDMGGFTDHWWGAERVRFLHTPGHGPHALSLILDIAGRQVVFCGDAVHAGATLHAPACLEWDHWTGRGILAAWEGIERLEKVAMQMLCPAHGPVIAEDPRGVLRELSAKLLAFYRSKGSICAGEPDRYVATRHLACGAHEVLPGLYQFGTNGYLLIGNERQGLVIDPQVADMDALDALLAELGGVTITASTATHYHLDHVDGAPLLKDRFETALVLHPRVAAPLRETGAIDCPWLPPMPILPDQTMPVRGDWHWGGYDFRVAPFPGQTWWHCCLMTRVAGTRVFFGGDNFQPPSRWNGTGGYCAFNGSRFVEGFARSAELVMDWEPDLIATGHGTWYSFARSHFEAIRAWAYSAEGAVRALCPYGDLEQDYYHHRVEPEA